MRRRSRLLTHSMVLTAAISLWLNPFCLLPDVTAVGQEGATLSDQDHIPHSSAFCDDHLLNAAGIGHDADISTKAAIGLRVAHLTGLPHDQSLVAIPTEISPPPASHSVSLPLSKDLYTLHSVYLI